MTKQTNIAKLEISHKIVISRRQANRLGPSKVNNLHKPPQFALEMFGALIHASISKLES